MHCIAITGNIGSGKSTAAMSFSGSNAKIVMTDTINTQILDRSSYINQGIYKIAGDISKTGAIKDIIKNNILKDAIKMKAIEAMLHPVIMENASLTCTLANKDTCVIEVPLLFEAGYDKDFQNKLLILSATSENIARVTAHRNNKSDHTRAITDNQIPDIEKIKSCDAIIINNRDRNSLAVKARRLNQHNTGNSTHEHR